jgi:hypothetical protein
MNHFAQQFRLNSVIVLDDGSATLDINRHRNGQEGTFLDRRPSRLERLKRETKRRLMGLDYRPLDRIEHFTIYDITPDERASVRRNEYLWLRAKLQRQSVSDNVYFIGSAVLEYGLMKPEIYYEHISQVCDMFGARKLVYVPHRREDPLSVDEIATKLRLPVVRFNAPIELALAWSDELPRELVGFVSTALDTCRVIFAGKMGTKIIQLPLQKWNQSCRKTLSAYYEYHLSAAPEMMVPAKA